MIETEKANKLVERGDIEIAPLAFMRGRTLNDSFIILDEAQNTTSEQMKMFLTRLGFNSKTVITGDITQIDLPGGRSSGLIEAQKIIEGHRRHPVRLFHEQGRRAPQAGAADHQGVRTARGTAWPAGMRPQQGFCPRCRFRIRSRTKELAGSLAKPPAADLFAFPGDGIDPVPCAVAAGPASEKGRYCGQGYRCARFAVRRVSGAGPDVDVHPRQPRRGDR